MKSAITRELAKIIPTIRCHGDFYATGESEIAMPNLEVDAMWEGGDRKPDWSKTGVAHSFSPKEHANGYA
ncbi:hypothetical protein R75461_08445 [Paraburkholderia nemoris]|nr:hypothetical protein R75461_08445 [Paraburkholderia nemoris]